MLSDIFYAKISKREIPPVLLLKEARKICEEEKNSDENKRVAMSVIAFIDLVESRANYVLSRYYKTGDTCNKSIIFKSDKLFLDILKASTGSKLRNRLFQQNIKAEYVVANNVNFISIDENNPKEIAYISKNDMYNAILGSVIYHAFIDISGIRINPTDFFYSFERFRGKISQELRTKLNLLYDTSTKRQSFCAVDLINSLSHIVNDNNTIDRIGRHSYISAGSIVDLNSSIYMKEREKILSMKIESLDDFHKMEELSISLLESTLLNSINDLKSTKIAHVLNAAILSIEKKRKFNNFGSLVSNLLDTMAVSTKLIESLTTNDTVEVKNPITGMTSYKSRRIPISGLSELDAKKAEKAIVDHAESISTIESFNSEMMRIANEKEILLSKQFKLVSGDDIVSAYNRSSYFDTKANKRSYEGGGTIYSSCMRHSSSKSKISFYAKNSHFIKLLVYSENGDKHISGRAVVWYAQDIDKYFVDRIYYDNNSTLSKIISYIGSKDNFISIHETGKGSRSNFAVKINKVFSSSDMPYLDSASSVIMKGEKTLSLYIGTKEGILKMYKEESSPTKARLGSLNINLTCEKKYEYNIPVETMGKSRCDWCGSENCTEITPSSGRFAGRSIRVCMDKVLKVGNKVISTEANCELFETEKSSINYFSNPISFSNRNLILEEKDVIIKNLSSYDRTMDMSHAIMAGENASPISISSPQSYNSYIALNSTAKTIGSTNSSIYASNSKYFSFNYGAYTIVMDKTIDIVKFQGSKLLPCFNMFIPSGDYLKSISKEEFRRRLHMLFAAYMLRLGNSAIFAEINKNLPDGCKAHSQEMPTIEFSNNGDYVSFRIVKDKGIISETKMCPNKVVSIIKSIDDTLEDGIESIINNAYGSQSN